MGKQINGSNLMINISPVGTGKLLAVLFVLVLLPHCAQLYCEFSENCAVGAGVGRLFNFDAERNIPTYYSVILLFVCAPLLYLHGLLTNTDRKMKVGWMTLALIFLFLSMDEFIGIHESIGRLVREKIELTGYLYFAWVIPYGIAIVVLFLVFIGFLRKLPVCTFRLFLGSGFVYVLGALGMELLGAHEVSTYSRSTIDYAIYVTIEESLEICGVSLFIYTLIRHLGFVMPTLKFQLRQVSGKSSI